MALSWQESTATAGQTTVAVNISYLNKADIHLEINEGEVFGFTWDSDTVVRLPATTTLAAGDKIGIIRKTDRDSLRLLFSEGAAFTRDNLDEQNTQFLYLAQELVEGKSIDGFYGTLSMNGYSIIDLATPINPNDATNKAYVDAADAILHAADAALDARTSALEYAAFNTLTVSYPWYTVLTEATDRVTPGYAFTTASVELNGVGQVPGYSFRIENNTVVFASTLPVGTMVYLRLGVDYGIDTDAAARVISQLSLTTGAAMVGDTITGNLATTLASFAARIAALES